MPTLIISILISSLLIPELLYNNIVAITLCFVSYQIIHFIKSIGKTLPIIEILGIFASITWLLAPVLWYHLYETQWYAGFSIMPISKQEYLIVALPGTMSLLLAIYLPIGKLNSKQILVNLNKARLQITQNPILWKFLVSIGIICAILHPIMPSVIAQIFYFGRNLLFIGLMYYLFTNKGRKINSKGLIIAIMMSLIISIYAGMFGDFIFWSLFFIIIYELKRKSSINIKIATTIIGMFMIIIIQSIKSDLRSVIWYKQGPNVDQSTLNLFLNLTVDRIENTSKLFSPASLSILLDRANQGYITAHAINYTPLHEPYAYGETIFAATIAAFIPRILWPNKPTAGGEENIFRFTGLGKLKGVSFNIAPLGDAYVNFGPYGGSIFLFFYACLFKIILFKIINLGKKNPTIILWIPLIFLAAIVAETDVVTTLNHLIKAIIFTWLMYYFSYSIFKIRL